MMVKLLKYFSLSASHAKLGLRAQVGVVLRDEIINVASAEERVGKRFNAFKIVAFEKIPARQSANCSNLWDWVSRLGIMIVTVTTVTKTTPGSLNCQWETKPSISRPAKCRVPTTLAVTIQCKLQNRRVPHRRGRGEGRELRRGRGRA